MSQITSPTHSDSKSHALISVASLLRSAYAGIDLTPLGTQLIEYSQSHPNDANALMDLSIILQLNGNAEIAMAVQTEALDIQQLYHMPTVQNQCAQLRLLAIMAPGDLMANTPLEFLLENSDIALDVLYLNPKRPFPQELPEHDILFIAVGESDKNRPLLEYLIELTKHWPRPVLNKPGYILHLSRNAAVSTLGTVPGIVMPLTRRLTRQTLEQLGLQQLAITQFLQDGNFPIIVRPVDSHAGQGLMKLDQPSDILDYLNNRAEDSFYIARFVHYAGSDGQFRKYRIVLIEGRPFVCHMGISQNWMIHYLNAGMSENAEKRAEEARFMEHFDNNFAMRHKKAFQAIYERFGLDYVGIDCGETPDGQLLIFEIDTGMIVHAMDPVDLFPYKQPQMQKVFTAFRNMLIHRVHHQQAS